MQTGATKALSKGLLKTNKLTFNGIVTNLEKTVSTINQVVPLYNQVKPLISNSKTIINAFKSTKNNDNQKKRRPQTANYINKKEFNPNIINVEISPTSQNSNKTKNDELQTIFYNTNTPKKPFFV